MWGAGGWGCLGEEPVNMIVKSVIAELTKALSELERAREMEDTGEHEQKMLTRHKIFL